MKLKYSITSLHYIVYKDLSLIYVLHDKGVAILRWHKYLGTSQERPLWDDFNNDDS